MSAELFDPVRTRMAQVMGLMLAMLAVGMAAGWPVAAPWLLVAVLLYGGVLWWRPQAFLLVIPALIPTLDLSMHTGRLYVDELDLFLIATLAVLMFRWQPGKNWIPLPFGIKFSLLLFVFFVVISLVLTLYPFRFPDENTWVHYTNDYHALRAVKGLVWALLLFICMRQFNQPSSELFKRWFVPGMVLGLVGCIVWVVWERATYPGLLDFSSRYRITGTFFDMHVGGPSIETYLVMSLPFVMLWAVGQRRFMWVGLMAMGIVGTAMYALAVTYSRAGYLGMGVALVVLLMGGFLAFFHQNPKLPRTRLLLIIPLSIVLSASIFLWVGGGGGVIEQRMSHWVSDKQLRMEHWELTTDLARNVGGSSLFGHGPGSFPRLYLLGNHQGRLPANFAYVMDGDLGVLRLGTGDSLFINQRLRLPWQGEYTLIMESRSDRPAKINVFVCEKPIRHSYGCRSSRVSIDSGESSPQQVLRFNIEDLKTGPWFSRRQLVLSLQNETDDSVIELSRLSMVSEDGREWLKNGDFSAGGRYWYFTTDHLWPWRVENVWLEIWLDLGWPGVLSFLLLIGVCFWHLLRRMLSGSFQDSVVLASLAGSMSIGLFSSIFWSPRLELLFFLILLLALAVGCESTRSIPQGKAGLRSQRIRHRFTREPAAKT